MNNKLQKRRNTSVFNFEQNLLYCYFSVSKFHFELANVFCFFDLKIMKWE